MEAKSFYRNCIDNDMFGPVNQKHTTFSTGVHWPQGKTFPSHSCESVPCVQLPMRASAIS